MTENPKVTVLLPAYNSGKYLATAVESILNQTLRDIELVIIDDCSTDGTWNVIQDFSRKDPRVIALRNEVNSKEAVTLNRGIAVAKGKYIARMDHDDWSYPDRLAKQFDFMEKHPGVGICGGTMVVCDGELRPNSQRRYATTDALIRKRIFRCSPFCHPAVMIRREVLGKSGLYDPAYFPPNDYELYFRIGRHAQFANLPDALIKYRVLEKSITNHSTRRLEQLTIAIRNKYAKEYKMSMVDRAYNLLQYLSIYLIPSWLKIRVFRSLRDKPIAIDIAEDVV